MLVRINKRSFEVESSEFDLFWKDMERGNWEPQLLAMLDQLLKPGDTVLDLGSWIGSISLYCAAAGAKVVAVEPDPEAYNFLLKNIGKNPSFQKNISCINVAVTHENESITLHARKNYGYSSSSTIARARDTLHSKNVRGLTLGTLLGQQQLSKINFIKMDIEGGEFLLLPSIREELKKLDYPYLYVSFHTSYLSEHFYLTKTGIPLLAKALIKTEELTGWNFFKKEKEKLIRNCVQALSEYKYIYSDSGKIVQMNDLLNKPLLVKNHSFIFSNQRHFNDL
jgi:FkbM family methyltransferase